MEYSTEQLMVVRRYCDGKASMGDMLEALRYFHYTILCPEVRSAIALFRSAVLMNDDRDCAIGCLALVGAYIEKKAPPKITRAPQLAA